MTTAVSSASEKVKSTYNLNFNRSQLYSPAGLTRLFDYTHINVLLQPDANS